MILAYEEFGEILRVACSRIFRRFANYFRSIWSRRFRISSQFALFRSIINREEPKTDLLPFTDKTTMKISLFSVAFSLSVVSLVSARRKKTEDDPSQSLEKEFSRVLGRARNEQKKVARHLSKSVSLTLSMNLKRFGVCFACFLVFLLTFAILFSLSVPPRCHLLFTDYGGACYHLCMLLVCSTALRRMWQIRVILHLRLGERWLLRCVDQRALRLCLGCHPW